MAAVSRGLALVGVVAWLHGACGGGPGAPADATDASFGELVFADGFEMYPAGWGGATPSMRADGVGSPAPSVMFAFTRTDIGTIDSIPFDGQTVLATLELATVFDGSPSREHAFVYFLVGHSSNPFVSLSLAMTRLDDVVTTELTCDYAPPVTVPSADGFRTLQLRVDATGTHCGIDGMEIASNASATSITGDVHLTIIAGSGEFSRDAVHYVDNVRLYRGP